MATAQAAEKSSQLRCLCFYPLFQRMSVIYLSRFPSFSVTSTPYPPFPSLFLFSVWRHIVLISFVMNMRPSNIKTILFKKWGTSDFPPNSFLLSAGFHSGLILYFICHLKWQVGLEMQTLFFRYCHSLSYRFLWWYKDKDNHRSYSAA